jgi:hypothetical protein
MLPAISNSAAVRSQRSLAPRFIHVALLALTLWACEDEAKPGNDAGAGGGSTGGQGGATPKDAAEEPGSGGTDPSDASGDSGGAESASGSGGAGGGDHDAMPATACKWGKFQTVGAGPPGSGLGPRPIYDPVGQRLIVVSRTDNVAGTLNVFSLALSGEPRWTMQTPQPSPDGGSVALPAPGVLLLRDRRLYAFQSPRQAMISLDLEAPTAWEVVPTEGETRLGRLVNSTTLLWDAPANRMIFFGGYGFEGLPPDFPYDLSFATTPATWNPLTLSAPIQWAMGVYHAIYDTPRRRLVVFRQDGDATAPPSLHSLSLADPPTWETLQSAGSVKLPSVKGSSSGHDSRGHRMMLFGAGAFDHGNTGGAAGAPLDGGEDRTARVYYAPLDGALHWRLLPTETPGPRWGNQAAIYDEANDRMLLVDPAPSVDEDMQMWFLDLASCR